MNIQAKRLLALLVVVLFGQSLSGVFVQAYMWEQGGDLGALSRYNFALFLGAAVAFVVLGPHVKRGRALLAVRTGLFLQVAFFLTVLLLGGAAGQYLELLGALNGLGVGAFWAGQNILMQQATDRQGRARFWGYVGASFSATALVGPLTSSRLVDWLGSTLGYQVVFALAAIAFASAGVISAGLATRPSEQPYLLREGLSDADPGRPWWRALTAQSVAGFRDAVLGFLPSILVYGLTGDPVIMGNFIFITSAVGLVTNWATGRYLPRHHWRSAMLVSGILQAGAALLMLANLSVTTLLLYSLISALVGPLMGVPFLSHTFDVIGSGESDRQMERIVLREVFLVIGRLAGMLLMLQLNLRLSQEATAMTMLALVAVAALLPVMILWRNLSSKKQPTA